MTTYVGDEVSELRECFDSLVTQRRLPDELVVVHDFDLPSELVAVIDDLESRADFHVRDVAVDERGRGHARKVGVERADSEFVAIIDADDIALPHRLERQLAFFESNPNVDVVGGFIGEFETSSGEVRAIREVPTDPDAVRRMAHYRSPVNHPTVMFRRQAVVDVGNYRHMEYGEDYELWCRLLSNDRVLANVPEVLVKARADGIIARRQGWDIAKREIELQRAIVETGFYDWKIALLNLSVRIPLRFFPKRLLERTYRRYFRS
jgi:glycosyltransferase involved in cell wall biosynthesis